MFLIRAAVHSFSNRPGIGTKKHGTDESPENIFHDPLTYSFLVDQLFLFFGRRRDNGGECILIDANPVILDRNPRDDITRVESEPTVAHRFEGIACREVKQPLPLW